jgi:glycosyltransferase involved in cell wall biosynthesis
MSMAETPQKIRWQVEYQIIGEIPHAELERVLILRVALHNTGISPWSHNGAHPITLSYHWLNQQQQPVDFEGVRTLLRQHVLPGERIELTMQIEPPPYAGEYFLALDMVEEGVNWFSTQGVPWLAVPVTVHPMREQRPRACIINGNCMINDAVGNHVLNQVQFLESYGYQTMALLEHVDDRHPAELRQHLAQINLAQLRAGPNNPQTRRAVNHFMSADIYIFNYSAYYELVDSIRMVGHGVTIFDYHGVTPPKMWGDQQAEMLIEGQRQLKLVRFAHYGIAHSDFTVGELLATKAIDPSNVAKLPYVVALDRFSPGPRNPQLLARYGLNDEQPILLYIGRMAANKRITDLVQAMPEILEQHPDAVLLLVGERTVSAHARVAAQAEQLAEKLGVTHAVKFTGQVPDAELPLHYQLADIFVTASLHEGFCIPVIEALATGVPVVGAHATALPETIGDGGLTFQPEDTHDLAQQVLAILAQRPHSKQA